jgi:short-subunit dehydrogenase
MSEYFKNSMVIITGAASGIGRELLIQFAEKKVPIIALDIDYEGLEESKNLAKKHSDDIKIFTIDLGNKEQINDFAAQIIPTLNNRKLILINNAGVALLTGNFDDTSLENMEWLFNINYWGAVRLTKAFYPYMIKMDKGHIVNVSSIFGLGGFAYQSAYCSSKFAIRGFTETLRMELLYSNIQTTCVHPGGIKTNITKNSRSSEKLSPAHQQVADTFAKMARTTPQKAASKIIEAIERKKEKLLIGPDAYLVDTLIRLFPVLYTKLAVNGLEKVFSDPYKIVEKTSPFKK